MCSVIFQKHSSMCRSPFEHTGAAALYLGFVLSHLLGEGSVVQLGRPGQWASLPCPYHYEDHSSLPELSVQWRGPQNLLLCHYVKHRAFQNCTAGYSISYSPANISLAIHRVRDRDFGTHLCSVSKRHEFSDSRVQLDRQPESVTLVPKGNGETLSDNVWTLLSGLLFAWFY